MIKKEAIKIFEGKKVRPVWDDETEEWYFSIIDVIAVLTDSDNPRKYWSVLKTRLKKEGNETAANCSQLKMAAPDDKTQEFKEHEQVAKQGGEAAEAARKQLESDLGHPVVSSLNAKTGLRLNKETRKKNDDE